MIDTLKKQWFVVLIALIFIGFTVFIIYDTNKGKLPGKSENGKDVIATINGKSISADDLYDSMYKSNGGNTLLYLRFQAAVIDESVKSPDEIEKTADQLKEYLNSNAQNQASSSGQSAEEYLKTELAKYGFQEDELDYFCNVQAKMSKMQKDYIDKHMEELFTPLYEKNKGRTVSHILVKMKDANNPTEEEMKTVKAIEKDLKTMSFAEVAKKYKDKGDTSSAEKGGYLGYMDSTTGFVDSFKKQALKMKKGEVSNWVKESNDNYNGWHMIKVEETDKDAILKDKKAKDSIYSAIENANSDLASKYISEAMKKLDVTYGNDDIKKDIQASLESK